MSARVLVVDDVLVNVRLLEAKLMAEYFDVLSATNAADGIELAETKSPDIILLDVMMPDTDGYEACRLLKGNPKTQHIPIIMVTALDQRADRIRGLEAGADDFLTKPVDDIALFARVKSLVRLKMVTDELRARYATGAEMGLITGDVEDVIENTDQAHILVVEDKPLYVEKIAETLSPSYDVVIEPNPEEALLRSRNQDYDLVIVSLALQGFDGLRLCSKLRAHEETRNLPILMLVDEEDLSSVVRGLEMGVNDYLSRPIDRHELIARTKTQIKRKNYSDKLRDDFQAGLEVAITDQLTGLYNRRYLSNHLERLIIKSVENDRPISLLVIDIDHFKVVNDSHGHDVGDEVLKEFARRLSSNVRGIDLACRYGGEEFVVAMPETDEAFAYMVAERLRQDVAEIPFKVKTEEGELNITISIGITNWEGQGDNVDALLKRADQALYKAKRDGRNRVVSDAA